VDCVRVGPWPKNAGLAFTQTVKELVITPLGNRLGAEPLGNVLIDGQLLFMLVVIFLGKSLKLSLRVITFDLVFSYKDEVSDGNLLLGESLGNERGFSSCSRLLSIT